MITSLVAIVGPTASGKSDLAMKVALKHNGEIICADSRTVYRGMDIGTAKSSQEDQSKVRHHLIDIVEPGQLFTAAEFKKLADAAILEIGSRGKLPIMVGGTGLYVDAVLFDYQFGAPSDKKLRDHLEELSLEELQLMCSESNIDIPINKQNRRHLIRAIELGGLMNHQKVLRSNTIVVGISTEREKLRARIEKRAHEMVERGIIEEVQFVGEKYGWDSEAMTANIYRIFSNVVKETKSIDLAIDEVVKSDMDLAKRQVTWFKRNKHIIWSDKPESLIAAIDKFVGLST
ncbi:MAG TPA: tRNA (adenosine(37)-N6)-dimethylallyltransferase MiaA [Patescibacteria group bacterium]|jgi:tRNA dimethylallyltransferase|nr:tRNA (adenosine(37)-N6)-dimethylallyltransferase MiaA [Patescibacteria group bacterium]